MKPEELKELDAWIMVELFGYNQCKESSFPFRPAFSNPYGICLECDMPKFTTDPAAAMDVLKKCAKRENVVVSTQSGRGWVGTVNGRPACDADTLELAICLFARKLLGK